MVKTKIEKSENLTDRLGKLANIPKEYLREDPPFPKSVKLELTTSCNFNCAYCAISARTQTTQRDMDFELFKKIANDLKECGVSEVGLFYIGEPYMSENLLYESITYLKDELKIPYVFITSNATLATPHTTKRLMKRGIDSIKWSVNFADPEQLKELARPPGKKRIHIHLFELALKNIQKAWQLREENKYKTKLYASSIRYNDEQVERMKPLLIQHILPYVDEHYWLPLLNEVPEFGRTKTPGNVGIYDKPVPPIPCWVLFTAGHVLVDGRFTCCCHDARGDWVMGDFKTQSLKEIWYSEKFRELRRAHLTKDVSGTVCEQCIDIQYTGKH